MRDPDQVLAAIQAHLGVELDETARATLRSRLDALSSGFEAIDAPAHGHAIASRVSAGPRLGAELTALHLEDLLLAQACLARDPEALKRLDERLPAIMSALRRRATAIEQDELAQQVRIRLLVPSGSAPAKLALYAGRGPLKGFIRVLALNLLNRSQAATPDASDGALAALPDRENFESEVLRADQQSQFREAFRCAVKLLTARQRALLRLNLLDGLSIDDIAPLYGAHRSSAARWLAEAKEALDMQTRKLLAELLKLNADEVERLLAATQSGFQLSLGRALRESLAPQS